MYADTDRHVMIDLETMSLKKNAAIVQIGVVPFDSQGCVQHPLRVQIELQSSLDAGLAVDGSTVCWWLKQSEAARAGIQKDPVPLRDGLITVGRMIAGHGGERAYMWAMPVTFDLPILESAFGACGLPVPWSHRHQRCGKQLLDTMLHLQPQRYMDFLWENARRVALDLIGGCEHDAGYDATVQAKACATMLLGFKRQVSGVRQVEPE